MDILCFFRVIMVTSATAPGVGADQFSRFSLPKVDRLLCSLTWADAPAHRCQQGQSPRYPPCLAERVLMNVPKRAAGIAPLLDHLVYATPDLAGTVAEFTRRTGVTPTAGGAHVGLGSRNYLVGLGGPYYLEIVGPDPEQPNPGRPRPFGIDGLAAPRMVTWAIRPPDLEQARAAVEAAGHEPGPVRAMSRQHPDGDLLEWRLTSVDAAGVVPFLIDWGSTAHPSAGLPGVTLLAMAASTPDPVAVSRRLTAVGTDLVLTEGPDSLAIRINAPSGVLELS